MMQFSWKNRKQEFLALVVFLCLWEVVAIKINNDIYLPRLEDILSSMAEIFKDKDFFRNVLESLYRSIISFVIAFLLSMVIGVLSVMYPLFRNLLKPAHSITKTIPTMVLVVLALVWFNKDKAPFIVGIFIVFPILYEGVINAIKEVDKNLIEMCDIYNVSMKEKILKIYLPSIQFYFAGILMSTFSLAFKVVIAGEVHGQPKYGIGSAVQVAKVNFDTTAIFAWILIIAIISIAFEVINKIIDKKVYRWRNENKNKKSL